MEPDFLQLRRLWADTFGDSEGYLDIFFSTYSRSALILTEERSGCLISALWGLPYRFSEGLKGLYLCGLATRPEWRGNGIMSRLMEEAEGWALRNNFDFSFLIPAGDDLRRYYARRGYLEGQERTVWELKAGLPEPGGKGCQIEDLEALEMQDRIGGRPRIIHSREDWEAVMRESDISGGKIFCSQICDSDEKAKIGSVAFGERAADQEAMKIVKVMGEAEASEKLLAELGAGARVKEPYGMWKPLSQASRGLEAPEFYLLLD